jgi:hypothetical protein
MRGETAVGAADHDGNIACVGGTHLVRPVTDAYRARWKALAKPKAVIPLLGAVRQIVIAETDDEARALAMRAYQRWSDADPAFPAAGPGFAAGAARHV